MFADAPSRPTIAVRDKAKAIGFYRDVLGLRLVEENPVGATFACGEGTFLEIYPSEFAGTAKNTVAGFVLTSRRRSASYRPARSTKGVRIAKDHSGSRSSVPIREVFQGPRQEHLALVELGFRPRTNRRVRLDRLTGGSAAAAGSLASDRAATASGSRYPPWVIESTICWISRSISGFASSSGRIVIDAET
jgi:hypothetical protein